MHHKHFLKGRWIVDFDDRVDLVFSEEDLQTLQKGIGVDKLGLHGGEVAHNVESLRLGTMRLLTSTAHVPRAMAHQAAVGRSQPKSTKAARSRVSKGSDSGTVR